jgi:hypothetical protein
MSTLINHQKSFSLLVVLHMIASFALDRAKVEGTQLVPQSIKSFDF